MANVTGTMAVTLAPVSTSGAGSHKYTGTAAVTLAAVTTSSAGSHRYSGTMAIGLAPVSVASTGSHKYSGILAATLAKVHAALAGLYRLALQDQEGEPEVAVGVNAQMGIAYTIRHADRERMVTFKNSSPVAVTIPAATGAFGAGWRCQIQNKGAGTVTLTPASGTINDSSSLALITNRGIWLVSDGTNWQVEGDLN